MSQQSKKFLTAEWRKLAMANYLVDAEVLKPLLPYGTELDVWNGNLYVSLVGFMFVNTKVLGIPIPFHRHFEEANLRFYVRYKAQDEWRRGVVFVKEIVPRMMITFVANTLYGEHYQTLKMRHQIETSDQKLRVEYGWKSPSQWNTFGVVADATAQLMEVGSEAEFITEHYWGYTKLNDKTTSQYQVEHPRWDIYPVHDYTINCNFEELYGKDLAPFLQQKPHSVFLAEGSPIVVRRGEKIKC